MKERTVYRESFKRPGAKIRDYALPELKHWEGAKVVEAYITGAGIVARGDEALHYHDLRVYVIETKEQGGK